MSETLSGLTVGEAVGVLAGLVGIIAGVRMFVRRFWPWLRRLVQFVDDVAGEEPRPGLPDGRPGLFGRLDRVESGLERVGNIAARAAEGIDEVRAITTPNGGSSLRDAVDRLEVGLAELTSDFQEHLTATNSARRDDDDAPASTHP